MKTIDLIKKYVATPATFTEAHLSLLASVASILRNLADSLRSATQAEGGWG